MPKYISGRVKRTPQSALTDDRYQYLGLEQTEPNLGDPTGTLPSVPVGQQYQIVSLVNHPGERYWVTKSGGIIPGAISLYDEGSLVGTADSISQVDFRGNAVSAIATPYVEGVSTGVAGTITVKPPGNNGSVLFKEANDFATSSNLVFNTNVGILTVGNGIDIGIGGTILTAKTSPSTGYPLIGVNEANPTQELDVNGDIRIRGTIYDYNNDPGSQSEVLTKGSNGVEWVSQGSVTAGAGGTIYDVQFHGTTGVVDGASNFVFRSDTNRVGIGSTQPTKLLDVYGPSRFRSGISADMLYITGVSTALNLINADGGIKANTASVTDLTTGRVVTVGTAGELQDSANLTWNNTTGYLGALSLTVSENTTTGQLNVTGITTIGSVKISSDTVTTTSGNLKLNSTSGTTQVDDILLVNSTIQSNDKDTGALVVEGGVGIEKNVNIGGLLNVTGIATLNSSGGITTTGGDLYVGGTLYLKYPLNLNQANFENLYVSPGISTFKGDVEFHGALGVTSAYWDKSDNALKFIDNAKAKFGTGGDLEIYYTDGDGSNDGSVFKHTGPHDMRFQIPSGAHDIVFERTDGANLAVYNADNSVDLHYRGSSGAGRKFQTSGIGVTVIGQLDATSAVLSAALTVGGDTNLNGNVVLGDANTDNITVNGEFNSNLIPDVNVTYDLGSDARRWQTVYARNIEGLTNLDIENLYVSGIATFKDDVQFHGTAGVTSVFWDKSADTWTFYDHVKAKWGNSGDLEIYHDEDNSIISDVGTGRLKILGSNVDIDASSGVDLKHNGVKVFETLGLGVTAIGNIAANSSSISGIATFEGAVHDSTKSAGSSGWLLSSLGASGTQWVSPGSISVENAEKVRVTSKSDNNTYHLTFVDDTTTNYQGINVDNDSLTWNASTNLLTAQKFKVESIEEWGSVDTGQNEQVITADGSGGWTWKDNTSGGIGTVFVKQYTKASGSSIAPFVPDAVERTCTSYITVDTTTAGISTIGIGETSNAYGNHWLQSDDPTSVAGGSLTVCDGDLWYDTTPAGGGSPGSYITGITIKDEGGALTTLAQTLNFVGGNVTASGTGIEKTITISGAAGNPAGSDTQVQYNNGGTAFGGMAELTYNDSTGDITLAGANYNTIWDKSADALEFQDNARANFGTNNDLQISHTNDLSGQNDSEGTSILDGGDWCSLIKEAGTGPFIFKTDGGPGTGAYQFYDTSWRPILKLFSGTSARAALYWGGVEKLITDTAGISITGGIKDKDGDLGTAGQVLSSTGTQLNWIDATSGSSTLAGLTDTAITSATKNDMLLYDGTSTKWDNVPSGVANVKLYGAVGDNATDDTAAIQAAIDSLSGGTYDGGVVYFPPGIYRISSALSIDSADNSITLKGCSTHFPLGGDGSLIRSTSTTANGIEITNSLSVSIQNLRIDTSVTKTDGIAIDCESSTDIQGITIDQVYINGFCKGINITGYSVSAVRNTEIRAQPNSANSTYGILVDKGSDTRVDQIRFQNIIIDAVHSGSSKHDYSSGFLFKNYVNSIWMYDCAVLRSKIGIDFDSTLGAGTASTGAFFRLTNCDVDQNKEDGVYINGGTQIWIDNPYLSSNGQNGLETGTSFGGTLWITNADARGNGYHGINISGTSAKKIHITNPHCAVNSTASSDTYHGINVASDADDIHIVGGQCGGDVYGTTTGATTNGSISQSYGIMFLGNNHKRIQIRGVDCTDNNSGAIGWQTSGDNVTAGSYNWIQYVAGYSTGQTTFP